MKRITRLVLLVLASCASVAAQDRLLTIDDIFSIDPRVRINVGGVATRLTWAADGRAFRQVLNGKPSRIDAITGQSNAAFDTDRLAAALAANAGLSPDQARRLAASPDVTYSPKEDALVIPKCAVKDDTTYRVATGGDYFEPQCQSLFYPDQMEAHRVDARCASCLCSRA